MPIAGSAGGADGGWGADLEELKEGNLLLRKEAVGGGGADREEVKEEDLLLEILVFVGFWSAREEKGLLLSLNGRPAPYPALMPWRGLLLNFESGVDVAVGE